MSDSRTWEPPRGLPVEIIRHNGGQRCDMLVGPCSCGAWHWLEEYPEDAARADDIDNGGS